VEPYSSLHSHSTYSFLDGFGLPEQMVKRAVELGMPALALTDHGSVSGHAQLEKYALKAGIKPIFGNEFYVSEDINIKDKEHRKKYHLSVIAMNDTGYKNLLKLTNISYDQGFYYKPSIDERTLFENNEGLLVFSGCFSSSMQQLLANGNFLAAQEQASRFKAVFGDRYYLELQHYVHFKDTYQAILDLSKKQNIPVIATIDNHYLYEDQGDIREFLWSIRDRRPFNPENVTADAALMDGETILKMLKLIDSDVNWTPMLEITNDIAERCNVTLKKGALPVFPLPEGFKNSYVYLATLCKEGLERRGITNRPDYNLYKDRILYELSVIKEKNFADYFLIVQDVVNYAKSKNILVGPSRGSAGGSLVAYALRITEIDPLRHDLMFERFIDLTRADYPDIDLDFEKSHRDSVKAYLVEKYGSEHAVQVGTFTQFKGKNSLDEVGKSFGIPKEKIEFVKSVLPEHNDGDENANNLIEEALELSYEAEQIAEEYPNIRMASKLEGQMRNAGVHVAGMLVSAVPLNEIMAFYSKGTEDGKKSASVDMESATYFDVVKLDMLGVNEMDMIKEACFANGMTLDDIYNIPLDDSLTIEGYQKADAAGVFQIKGYSSRNVLKKFKVTDFNDIAALMNLPRPGPLNAGSTDAYIKRKNGKPAEGFDWHPRIAEITKNTQGQILYQEQVIQIVKDLGHFDIIEASAVRKLISKSKGEEAFGAYVDKFVKGCQEEGLTEKQAHELWQALKTHGKYSFNVAHAVGYAYVSFWSMYCKQHFPLHFYMTHIREQDETDDKRKRMKKELMQEATRKGYNILGPRFGYSKSDWSIDQDGNIRAGLVEIDGIAGVGASQIEKLGYFTKEDIESMDKDKITTGIKNKLLKNEQYFEEQEDYFQLNLPAKVYAHVGDKIADLSTDEEERDVELGCIISTAQLKNIFEEMEKKGLDVGTLYKPEEQKYAVLSLEDNTGSCTAILGRFQYGALASILWDSYKERKAVRIVGKRPAGKSFINIKDIRGLR